MIAHGIFSDTSLIRGIFVGIVVLVIRQGRTNGKRL